MEGQTIDFERWLNELRHKYVAIVSQAAAVCWKTDTLKQLESTYQLIMHGAFPICYDESGKQFLDSTWLTRFSLLIELARTQLNEFLC